jgi:tripartite-type tricarboxylate transporter receptor subunit TctC
MNAPAGLGSRLLSSYTSRQLNELIAFAKANPGKLNYASSGNGSIQHIAVAKKVV